MWDVDLFLKGRQKLINGKRNSGVKVVEYYKWYIEVMRQFVYYPERNCED